MDEKLDRVSRALNTQCQTARVLLEHPERDPNDFHVSLAGVLRSMLCDRDSSTLLMLASELGMDLRVWGPYPPSANHEVPPTWAMDALIASADPAADGYEMSLAEYMGAPIGVVPPDAFSRRGTWYTPRELIRWTADKEGAAHLDPKRHPSLSSIAGSIEVTGLVTMKGAGGAETPIMRNDDFVIRVGLLQIAQMAVALADKVLARHR